MQDYFNQADDVFYGFEPRLSYVSRDAYERNPLVALSVDRGIKMMFTEAPNWFIEFSENLSVFGNEQEMNAKINACLSELAKGDIIAFLRWIPFMKENLDAVDSVESLRQFGVFDYSWNQSERNVAALAWASFVQRYANLSKRFINFFRFNPGAQTEDFFETTNGTNVPRNQVNTDALFRFGDKSTMMALHLLWHESGPDAVHQMLIAATTDDAMGDSKSKVVLDVDNFYIEPLDQYGRQRISDHHGDPADHMDPREPDTWDAIPFPAIPEHPLDRLVKDALSGNLPEIRNLKNEISPNPVKAYSQHVSPEVVSFLTKMFDSAKKSNS